VLGETVALFLPVGGWASNHDSSMTVQSSRQNQVPVATLPGTDDEMKWWQALRTAGNEAITAWALKDEAIAKAKRRQIESRGSIRSSEEKDLIPPAELARLNAILAEATKKFVNIIREGREKSYRVPVSDSPRPIILHKSKPIYTDEARKLKINGSVVISLVFGPNGVIDEIEVVRGLEGGLNEKASDAARQILFLPAIKGGAFVSVRSKVEMTFNVY